MFTGIIEALGQIENIEKEGANRHITIASSISAELIINQSVAHNGACLSVTNVEGNTHTVTAINETLQKSSLGGLEQGDQINLERAMPANGRFDGHIVQGHVDTLGKCEAIIDEDKSWLFRFSFEPGQDRIVIDKGSITVDGTSLTVVEANEKQFSVAIIPSTYQQTLFHTYCIGTAVNLEFDLIGKYVQRLVSTDKK